MCVWESFCWHHDLCCLKAAAQHSHWHKAYVVRQIWKSSKTFYRWNKIYIWHITTRELPYWRLSRQGTGGPMGHCISQNVGVRMPFSGDSLPVTPVLNRKGKGWGVSGWLIKRSGGNAWRFLSIFCGSFTNHTLLAPFLSSVLLSGRNETNSKIKNPGFVVIPSDLLNLSASAHQNKIRPRETMSANASHRTYVNIPLPIPKWGWVLVIPGHNTTIPKYDKTGRSVHDGKPGKIL